jgi:adenylate kinase
LGEAGISDHSVGFSPAAKSKVVFLGSPGEGGFPPDFRSLNLEHVSPALLKGRGISPPAASPGRKDEVALLALMRRWFFARKPDAGFVLTDFPATLLQAKVFDEWLETRGEALSAVLAGPGAPEALVEHYGTLGLLQEPGVPAQP